MTDLFLSLSVFVSLLTDLYRILERKRSFGQKCVKIKEGEATEVMKRHKSFMIYIFWPDFTAYPYLYILNCVIMLTLTMQVRRLERDLSRRSRRKGKGMAGRKFRTSASLSQLSTSVAYFRLV